MISTRRGNGAGWSGMIGKPPTGEWELSFNFDDAVKDQEIRKRFKNDEISDILLVITDGGRTPVWPAWRLAIVTASGPLTARRD